VGDMIISKATENEIKSFSKKAWQEADFSLYGRNVRWMEKKIVFKAVENKKIIGSIKAKYEAGVIYIGNIIIAKDQRRTGIGRELMARVEKEGKKLGGHKIYLFTGKKWKGARRFYKRLGYRKTGDLPHHFFKHDFVIYSKAI